MNPDPEIVAEFDAITWHFLPENEEAVVELEDRLLKAAVGKRARPLVYSEWVRDVVFRVPGLYKGESFTMETSDWKAEYQHVVGDTLGWINARSYKAHGILLSSMAISKESNQPGERFYGLAHDGTSVEHSGCPIASEIARILSCVGATNRFSMH